MADDHEEQFEDATEAAVLPREEQEQGDSFMYSIMSQAPWWLVSVVFHILLIILAYMFSIAINLDTDEREPLVTVTQLTRPTDPIDDKKPKEEIKSALMSDRDTHPTDEKSTEVSNIEVPKNILAQAEIGDHFETINMDRPDTHSAFGTPDSHMFHSVKGSDDAAGGGGTGGATLEDMIGAGAARSPGSGGGWGGGKGTGVGNDSGSGRGSFGNRGGGGRKLMVKRHGGSKQTENAVDGALRWLAYHQETDGHWDSKKYGSKGAVDEADTGFALLAFLGAGHSEKVGEYKDNVRRGVAWLKSKQAANGSISQSYSIAITAMALAEAAAMANVPDTRDAAQKAITYCTEIHQFGEGSDKLGWRYGPKSEGDLSVTGWFIMALKSAKVAGLHVDAAAFDGGIKFLDTVEIKGVGGDPGYAPPSMYSYMAKGGGTPRLTAIGCLCRQFMGWKKDDLQSSVEGFVAKGGVPAWAGNGDHIDLYYWYYGTLCTFQQGGEMWKKWNEALKKALTDNQRRDGDDTGSWDPVGAFSEQWGRVGQTAIGALCLEVYYRYQKLAPEN